MTAPLVVWDPRMLGYDLGGDHPLHPLRWELTWALAGELGVLDHYEVLSPDPADDETLGRIHTPAYIAAVRDASEHGALGALQHGLGTDKLVRLPFCSRARRDPPGGITIQSFRSHISGAPSGKRKAPHPRQDLPYGETPVGPNVLTQQALTEHCNLILNHSAGDRVRDRGRLLRHDRSGVGAVTTPG